MTLPAITLACVDRVGTDLGSDDPAHARRVAAAVPGITHVELPLPGEVDPYAALTEMPRTDEPFPDVSIFARLRWWMTTVRELGGRAHLTGDGGDAVLTAPPAYLADFLAQRCGGVSCGRRPRAGRGCDTGRSTDWSAPHVGSPAPPRPARSSATPTLWSGRVLVRPASDAGKT